MLMVAFLIRDVYASLAANLGHTFLGITRTENMTSNKPPIRLLECGCCGCYHPENSFQPGGSANYMNDCRYDANRFANAEDFTERTGLPAVEVWLDEQEAQP
jgi:hypothetical protein